jgi:hypothetical protein
MTKEENAEQLKVLGCARDDNRRGTEGFSAALGLTIMVGARCVLLLC